MSQMYNNLANLAIAKTRYSFRKGYMKVSLEDKNDVRQEIMDLLGITYLLLSYFCGVNTTYHQLNEQSVYGNNR